MDETKNKTKYTGYRLSLRELLRQKQEERKRKQEEGLILAQKYAKILGEKFGATKVYLFGSLAEDLFWEGSDIDLAVEGMGLNHYLRALAELRVIDDMHLDIVHLNYCRIRFKNQILKNRKVKTLYEQRNRSL